MQASNKILITIDACDLNSFSHLHLTGSTDNNIPEIFLVFLRPKFHSNNQQTKEDVQSDRGLREPRLV